MCWQEYQFLLERRSQRDTTRFAYVVLVPSIAFLLEKNISSAIDLELGSVSWAQVPLLLFFSKNKRQEFAYQNSPGK